MAAKGATKGAHILHDLKVALSAGDWVGRAACSPAIAELFWPLKGQSVQSLEPALKTCSRCPVVRQCGQWAIDTHQTEGIWGGMRPAALQRLVAGRRAAQRKAAS